MVSQSDVKSDQVVLLRVKMRPSGWVARTDHTHQVLEVLPPKRSYGRGV